MFSKYLAGAIVLATIAIPHAALADDPHDPAMLDRAARERDAAEIRRLNREQDAYVKERDAGYQAGWQAYRAYPEAREDYERQMAEWRRAVRLCQTGHYEYCDRR